MENLNRSRAFSVYRAIFGMRSAARSKIIPFFTSAARVYAVAAAATRDNYRGAGRELFTIGPIGFLKGPNVSFSPPPESTHPPSPPCPSELSC